MSILKAYHTQLNDDTNVTDRLGKYKFGSTEEPAIFTVDPAPSDAKTTLAIISIVSSTISGTDREHRGGEFNIDVRMFGEKEDSAKTIEELAFAIWQSLDRANLVVNGYEATYTFADPPFQISDPDGYPGFVVSCRTLLREI